MLQLRPNCEHCDRDLPPESNIAMICSFERTFCQECAASVFASICPNCGGNFAPRPIRPPKSLLRYPAADKRIVISHSS
ncbi:MAG: DUF1272 domain-containing protein [Proteobacteria bacterium]|nr:DUF1272 domain-containing protein [Pseudomonadota bacterium]